MRRAALTALNLVSPGHLQILDLGRKANYGLGSVGIVRGGGPTPREIGRWGGRYVIDNELVQRLKDAWPDLAVKVKYDYDVLGISEARKQILIIDAKFRDMSPSSISAQTLISQELMEPEEGICYEAERHRARLDYFLNNRGLFKQHLKPLKDLRDYQVRGYVVTKHTPLISQYKNIGILSLADLVESELKA